MTDYLEKALAAKRKADTGLANALAACELELEEATAVHRDSGTEQSRARYRKANDALAGARRYVRESEGRDAPTVTGDVVRSDGE